MSPPERVAARVAGRHGDGWKIRVAAPPARGRANAALEELLAETLAVSRAGVRIVAGLGSRTKLVEVEGPLAEAGIASYDPTILGGIPGRNPEGGVQCGRSSSTSGMRASRS